MNPHEPTAEEEARIIKAVREAARWKYTFYARWTQTGDSDTLVAKRLGQELLHARQELEQACLAPLARLGDDVRAKYGKGTP